MKRFKRIIATMVSVVMVSTLMPNVVLADETSSEQVLAFPEADGGGKYAKGARGSDEIEVYHVTNTNNSGEGSLVDALSKEGRIVVFDTDGVIKVDETLRIPSNTTILAQTAPGEGITVTGNDVQLVNGAKDVIVRYLKVRPTDLNGGEPDGLGGQFGTRIIYDHCSISWGVDELLTLYAGSYESVNVEAGKPHGSYYTVSNTISAESLRMSSHFKGAHGYGAIMGADTASYHHNLLAHHDSRSPRLDREMNGTEVVNNVIYDWGQTNSAYGGEPYSMHNKSQNPTNVNYYNNYYNYGASTKSSIRSKIFEFTNKYADTVKGNYYITGNYVYGDSATTSDNTKGLKNPTYANLLSSPNSLGEYQLTPETAEDARQNTFDNVGATLPKRDAIDARIINDVKNLTGRVINKVHEVGGEIDLNKEPTEQRVFTIPSDWISEKGLSAYKENEIITDGEFKGYTLIEAYVNDWTAKQEAPTNANITVISPVTAGITNTVNGYSVARGKWETVSEGETVNYHAVATPVSGTTIEKFELYDGNTLLKDYGNVAEINDNITLDAGIHYLTSRAYNSKGEKTQSTEAIVYVKKTGGDTGEFKVTEIKGNQALQFAGKSGVSVDENGVYTLYGSGSAGVMSTTATKSTTETGTESIFTASNTGDSCTYLYKPVTGNFDIKVKIESVPKFENQQINGLMFRETLDAGSRMTMITDGWLKLGQNERIISRDTKDAKSYARYFKNKNGVDVEQSERVDYPSEPYMRIVRYGDDVYLYVSDDGEDWTDNTTRKPYKMTFKNLSDTVYIGYATDSADTLTPIPYLAESKFSGLSIVEGSDVEDPSAGDDVYVPSYVKHETANGFKYSESFLMKDTTSNGKWIISSDGDATKCYEDIENIAGNETPKLALIDKATQISIPKELQSGKYQLDFDMLTTNTADAGRSFRIYMDNAIHPYDETTGKATEMGTDGAFLHITDLAKKVYSTTQVADISAKAANDTMNSMYDVDANSWYHYTITGTNGSDDINVTVSKHGSDGQYDPINLSSPVYDGKVSATEGRDTIFKQLKFMKTAGGELYFDNINFTNLDVKVEGSSHDTENGFQYVDSFLMKDTDGDGKWIISSDGSAEKCFEDVENISGNSTAKLALTDKAVQIEIPEKYQSGKYNLDFDFLTTNEMTAGRSFRIYMDNAVHPYDETTGQATEMGSGNAFVHITDLAKKVYATTSVADIEAKVANDTMNPLFDIEANSWYHYSISGTNGSNEITVTISKHGQDGKYNTSNLATPVYSGKIATTEGRDSVFKQLKFMRTAGGELYFDNIVFAGDNSSEPTPTPTEKTGDVDQNGRITANDAAAVLQYVLNPNMEVGKGWNIEQGDVDDSGVIEINDAVQILNKVLNSSYKFDKRS